MSLADLAQEPPAIPANTCAVCHVTTHLDPHEQELLPTVLASHITNRAIATDLTTYGLGQVSTGAVKRHRTGECAQGKVYRT